MSGPRQWHFVTIKNRHSIELHLYEGGDTPTHERRILSYELTPAEMHDLNVKLTDVLWGRSRKLT